jgi:hypothetical protein
MESTSFLRQNFDILYRSNPELEPEEAEIFLLCETHVSKKEREWNAELIDLKADENSLVLVEAVKTQTYIQARNHIQTVYMKKEVPTYGWDMGTFASMYELSEETGCLYEELNAMDLEVHRLEKELGGVRDQKSAQIRSRIKEIYAEASKKRLKMMQQSDWENVSRLLKETFNQRTFSMVESLTWAEEKVKESAGKIFLVAGEMHLNEKVRIYNDLSLKPLFDHLSQRNAVILRAKVNTLEEYLGLATEKEEEAPTQSCCLKFCPLY